jgi:hypothetical protein
VIFRRLLLLLASLTALAVSAGVVVVALAYAIYALVKPFVGAAGAAGVVALAAALFIALIGAFLGNLGRAPRKKPGAPESIVDRIVDFVRNKPVTATAGAIAAGLLAVRNPQYLGALVRAFVEGRDPPPRGK